MFRWRLLLILILVLGITSFGCTREETGELHAGNQSSKSTQKERLQFQWLDFSDGLAKAKTDNKPVFIEFYAEWCVACKTFHRETLQNENVGKMLARNFVSVLIDVDNDKDRIEYKGKYYSSVGLSQSFGITGVPSLIFLEPGGQPITKLDGFVPPTQFSAVLNYIHQQCYQTKISFHDFVRKGKCN